MDDLKMDDINGVQPISAEEQRLIDLKKKLKWFTATIVVAAIAIAGMLAINFYPELFRRLLGDQERGDLANATVTYTNVETTRNLRSISGTSSSVYLGVEIQNISEAMANAMNLKSNSGVVITRVTPSSPADISGLQAGDIIVRFDRVRVKTTSDIQDTLKDEDPGDVIKVVVDRDGMIRSYYVELGSLSSAYARQSVMTIADSTTQQTADWGCTISSLTPDLIARLSIPNSVQGVVVVAVSATGLAKSAGMLVGDVILKVNRHIIVNLQDFYQSIENQSLVVLEIYRSGRLTYIQIQSANAIPPVATIAGTVADAPPILQNRVAIAANGNDLNAQLSPYFGSAPFFIIVDLSTKQYSAVPNNAATGTVPYGIAAVQLVTASGAKAVIAQNYGPVMYQALMAAQLTLFRANPGKVLDALAQYESYLLTQVDSPTVQGMTRNVVPSGGSPFTSDDTDDEEEEQSGYKGMPYTIPPQGKYDPDLDPANAAQTTAGTTQYRVAIASLGTSISAGVAPLFGTAPYFIIYDSTTNQYQYMKNPALTDTRSYGAIATQAIVSQNINAVIAGNFGSRAYTALLALNIKPYVFQGTISDAINAYRSGKLLPAVSTSLPGFTYTQNIVPTGGAPFATDDEDDEEEEQSGYKGVPYTIPPQGKYDPTLDPNNAATTDQSSNVPAINPSIPQRVAVAATGNTLNASMASVFRTAPFYLIVDIQTNQFFAIQNLYVTNITGTNVVQPAQLVASTGARATIAGMYGPICYSLLTSYNIVPYSANPGTILEVLKLYKAGALKIVSQTAALPLQTQVQNQLLTTAGSTQRTDYCYCPYCRITIPHPSSVPCSALECPQCGNRLMNWDASGTLQTTVVPQLPVYSSVVAGVLSAGSSSYVQVPLSSQQLPTTYVLPQTQYYQDLIQNQLRTGSTNTDATNLLNLNQQTQYCYCPHCNVVYEHPRGVPCSSLTCTACGNRLISLNSGVLNQLTDSYGATVSGQPSTIPPMGQTTAGVAVSGQPATIPPMGQTTAGMPVAGQPTTIPMGQTTAGMPTAGMPTAGMPTAGMPTAGMPTAGMPTAGMPTAGMPTAGMPVAGMPTAGMPTAGMPTAGMPTAGMPTAGMPTAGMPTAGIPVAGMPTAGMPTAGMPTAGMPTAGMPVAGMPTAGMPVAGQPELIPPMGQTAAGVMVSGQPATIPPMGQTTAGTVSQTSTGALQGTVDGNCVCPVCGTTVPHERGTACYTIPCPKCKTLMVNEGAIINRTAITTTAVNTTPVQLTTALTIAGAPSTIPMTTTPGQVNTTTDTLSATPVTGIIDLPAMTIAGTGSGSVCIAATGPKITSQVADIFDKAPYFLIVGLGKIKAIPNPNVTDLLGSGVQSAQLIVSEGAKVLITNDIGIRAIKELETLNVKVYTGIKGTAEQALSWYQDNRLSPTVLGANNNATTEEEHGPPTSSKSKSKGETSL